MSWNKRKALRALGIKQVEFDPSFNPDAMGYAGKDYFAVERGPKNRTLELELHEIAHIVLGHTRHTGKRCSVIVYELGELEASAVAIRCVRKIARVDWPVLLLSYQSRWRECRPHVTQKIKSRITRASNKILKAGGLN